MIPEVEIEEKNILEKIKSILSKEPSTNPDVISVWEIITTLEDKQGEEEQKIYETEEKIKFIVNEMYSSNAWIDFKKQDNPYDVTMYFQDIYNLNEPDNIIVISKNENGILFIKYTSNQRAYKLVEDLYDELGKLYDLKINFYREKVGTNNYLYSLEEDFLLYITDDYVTLRSTNYSFEVSCVLDYLGINAEIDVESRLVQKLFKTHKKDLLKRINVNISDCPLILQERLYTTKLLTLKRMETSKTNKNEVKSLTLKQKIKNVVERNK